MHGVPEAFKFYDTEPGKDDHDLCMEHELSKMEAKIGLIFKDLKKEKFLDYINKDKIETIVNWGAWIFVVTKFVNHKPILKLFNHEKIGVLIDQYEKILPLFKERIWTLGFAPNGKSLFSSDSPVSLLDPESPYNPVSLNNCEIFIPLSPQILLRGSLKNSFFAWQNGVRQMPDEIVDFANFSTYIKATKLVVAKNKKNLEDFLKQFENKFGTPHITLGNLDVENEDIIVFAHQYLKR